LRDVDPSELSLYHKTVAVRKKTKARLAKKNEGSSSQGWRRKSLSYNRQRKSRISWAVLFWLAFAIFIFGLFILNREVISSSIRTIQNEMALHKAPGAEKPVPEPDLDLDEYRVIVPAPVLPSVSERSSQAERSSAELRERVLYFIQVDRSGTILRVKVNRKFPVSDSPMADVIKALIAGPNEDEKRKDLISLIPLGTRIISATIRGSTAYINFNEDFLYNTFGIEGYEGQLRQIVFTVTEFPNVKDVQFLIEGQRIDYLGEGIWIGSPLSREIL
jgi:spore germination protein GerM